jgi:UDP-N-acetylmuramate dehydrogenase
MGNTDNREFSVKLRELMKEGRLLEKEPMAKHITFRVGGPADWYAYIETVEMLRNVIALCRQYGIPYYIIGNGSNVLVSDDGIRGVVLRLSGEFDEITLNESVPEGICRITAGAGTMLSRLSMAAGKKGFTGLEFAGGIPGTIGGAVLMNAGAYGGEIKDTIWAVDVLEQDGTIVRLTKEELELSYRHSRLMETGGIVLKAYFTLKIRPKIEIFAAMESYKKARQEKQPLELPSAGSTFKRPAGYFAGKLIQDAGLKGCKIGGAQVSEKHAGFVVNAQNATAADVRAVIEHVKKTVKEQFGVELEPEVRFLGEFK